MRAIWRGGIAVLAVMIIAASLLGPGPACACITTLATNAAGDQTQLSPSPPGSNYLRVQTNDGDTSYVYTSSASYLCDLYNFTDVTPSGTINSVTVTMVARSVSTATQSGAYTVIKTGGTQYNGTPRVLTTSYTAYATVYNTNPGTGSAWTWSQVNALQAGVALRRSRTTGSSSSRASRCTNVYVTIDCTPVSSPTLTTDNATSVEETTATLGGTLTNDGGEACQYRFEYDIDSGEPYSYSSPWTGSITSGQSFTADISSLGKGTVYYFRAQAKNSAGTVSANELHLLTKPEPPAYVSASAVSDTSVSLNWTKGEGANRTMIRRKTGGYPADLYDGVAVYFDTGVSVTDTGLTPDTPYYYKAWSEVSGSQQWSDGFAVLAVTTGSAAPPVTVGGRIYRVNKAAVLAPYLIISSAIAAIVTLGICLRRKLVPLPAGRKKP